MTGTPDGRVREETAGLPAPRDHQFVAGPRGRHEEQGAGALFLLPVALGLVVPAGLDPLMRNETLAHPGEKDPLELQPLEAVQRADAHGVRLRRDVPADLAGADAVLLIGEGG